MPDRNDVSQSPNAPVGQNPDSFYGDTTMDPSQVQTQPNGIYANPRDIVDYHDPAETPDFMAEHPGEYLTAIPGKIRRTGKPTQVNGPGNYKRGSGFIAGFSFLETAGAIASLVLHDGADANAPIILVVGMPANGNSHEWYLPGGVQYQYGIYVEVITGAFKGALFVEAEIQE